VFPFRHFLPANTTVVAGLQPHSFLARFLFSIFHFPILNFCRAFLLGLSSNLQLPTSNLRLLCYISSMRARAILSRGALACALLLAAVGLMAGPKDKEPAPRFNATTTTGEKFTNDAIKGKVVLLEFWTTWCGYCADEAGFVDKIGHDFADKGLILLAIDVGESKKTVKKYLEQHPRTCKIVYMEDTNLAAMYAATVYPIYVVIDRDGYISGTQRGAGGEEALKRLLVHGGLEMPEDSDSE
jgi:thiol-disulfide isomerase/thioredoxin